MAMQVLFSKFFLATILMWSMCTIFIAFEQPPPPLSLDSISVGENQHFKQCIERSDNCSHVGHSNGYIMASANGGLNQMRAGICDMVAVAKMMNATLVIPSFDHDSYWKDPSNFENIFEVDHFIDTLKKDVKIIKSLPPAYKGIPAAMVTPKSFSTEKFYKRKVLPMLKEVGVVRFTHTNTRLANNFLPKDIQKLRCKANYKALKWQDHIQNLANTILERMRSIPDSGGRFLALHLRYEKDMLAFTGCTHGLSNKEAEATRLLRKNTRHWRIKVINSEAKRQNGECPLTPREVALFLKALGFPSSTHIYLVAGSIFGNNSMAFLKEEFPYINTHNTICSEKELEPFLKYQNQLAAVDSIVALESDVFVHSFKGNMAKMVEGQRRFAGHRPTIAPNTARLVKLLDRLEDGRIYWEDFEKQVRKLHMNRLGGPSPRKQGPKKEEDFSSEVYPSKPGSNNVPDPKQQEYSFSPRKSRQDFKIEENFYANPLPDCICQVADR